MDSSWHWQSLARKQCRQNNTAPCVAHRFQNANSKAFARPWNPPRVVGSGRCSRHLASEHASRSCKHLYNLLPSVAVRLVAGSINLLSAAQPQAHKGQNPSATSHLKRANSMYDKQAKIASLRRYSSNLVAKTKALPAALQQKLATFEDPGMGSGNRHKNRFALQGASPVRKNATLAAAISVTAKQKGDMRSHACR